jgi:hypothetical protein
MSEKDVTDENFAPSPKLPDGAFVNAEIRIVSYFNSNGNLMYSVSMGGSMNVAQAIGLLALGGIQIYRGYEIQEDDEDE